MLVRKGCNEEEANNVCRQAGAIWRGNNWKGKPTGSESEVLQRAPGLAGQGLAGVLKAKRLIPQVRLNSMQEWARQRLSFAGRPSRAVSLAGWPPLHPLATAARRPAREM